MRGKRMNARLVVRLEERAMGRIKAEAKEAGTSTADFARLVLSKRIEASSLAEAAGHVIADRLTAKVGEEVNGLAGQVAELVRAEVREELEGVREKTIAAVQKETARAFERFTEKFEAFTSEMGKVVELLESAHGEDVGERRRDAHHHRSGQKPESPPSTTKTSRFAGVPENIKEE